MRRKSFIKPLKCIAILYIFNLTMLSPLSVVSKAQASKGSTNIEKTSIDSAKEL